MLVYIQYVCVGTLNGKYQNITLLSHEPAIENYYRSLEEAI